MSVEDIRIGDAPITHITASPMPRPPSVIARIGSRLSQRYSSVEPGAFDADASDDRWQDRPLTSSALGFQPTVTERGSRRASMFQHLADNFLPGHHARGRRRLAPISRPIPIDNPAQYELIGTARQAPSPQADPSSHSHTQRSRLSRVRRSISGPLEALLGSSSNRRLEDRPPTPYYSAQPQETLAPSSDETEYLLPPINIANTAINLEDRPTDPVEDPRPRADTPIPGASSRSSWAERWTNRSSTIRRDQRRVPNLLRGRSSRLIRRDDETPLSRILQLAAAAIAAQLSGSTDALANLEPVGDEALDGSLNHFVEDLNNAAGSVQAAQDSSSTAAAGPAALNFWRAFRFVGPAAQRPAGSAEDGSDPRTVTLVVVGVRSVPSTSLQDGARENGEPGFNSILDLPTLSARGPQSRPGRSGSLLRNLNGRSRLGGRAHRSSMSDVDTLVPRSGLSRAGESTRPRSTIVPRHMTFGSSAMRESPPGPNPPPTTPAEFSHSSPNSSLPSGRSRPRSTSSGSAFLSDELSADSMTSASDTPGASSRLSRRASRRSTHAAASALASNMNHDLMPDGDNIPMIPDNVQVRQRRRSDSEQARSRNLASHRNGTIDPDGGPTQRSWLIYVVGTNLPENHPAFLTPSLFSDVGAPPARAASFADMELQNPTYEDLVNLQNLIGVVKPRVADQDDIANAGGVYTITAAPTDGGMLVATSAETGEQLGVPVSDACIVCLDPYVAEQQIRRLAKCQHVFHRDCVDHWLLSGCNSCPLCRGKGVEKAAAATGTEQAGRAASGLA